MRLALTKDGRITKCVSKSLGEGRCNHIVHQLPNESSYDFIKRISNESNLIEYYYSDEIDTKDISNILGGSQPKTVTIDNKYIKFDSIEKDHAGRVVMKYSYPSVQEVISSCMIRNSDITTRIRCADYRLCVIIDGDLKRTASISNSYISSNEKEFLLSNNYGKSISTIMSGKDYRDILNSINVSNKLLDEISLEMKCSRDTLEDQFNDKCILDMLLGNSDISNNPMNFVLTRNIQTGDVNIISMDYGRCLSFGNGNGYLKTKENFEPFKININKFVEDSKQIIDKYSSIDSQLGIYAQTVLSNAVENLNKNEKYWNEVN